MALSNNRNKNKKRGNGSPKQHMEPKNPKESHRGKRPLETEAGDSSFSPDGKRLNKIMAAVEQEEFSLTRPDIETLEAIHTSAMEVALNLEIDQQEVDTANSDINNRNYTFSSNSGQGLSGNNKTLQTNFNNAGRTRKEFIEDQKRNRYSDSSLAPFIVYIESCNTDHEGPKATTDSEYSKNVGNLHPMAIGTRICRPSSGVTKIDRRSANMICVTFNSYQGANDFIQNKEQYSLPKDWLIYIPNHKIYRTGIIRNVYVPLTTEQILEGIRISDNQIKINNIERLKYLSRNGETEHLRDSPTIKIIFEANLLPEYLLIWGTKCRVLPFINKVRKCLKCSRWGHSRHTCKGSNVCPRCALNHTEEECQDTVVKCTNCGERHYAFDTSCKVFGFHRIVNTIMAYANVNSFKAKLLKRKFNIKNIVQAEATFRYLTYDSPNTIDKTHFIDNDSESLDIPVFLDTAEKDKDKHQNEHNVLRRKNDIDVVPSSSNQLMNNNTAKPSQIPRSKSKMSLASSSLSLAQERNQGSSLRIISGKDYANSDLSINKKFQPQINRQQLLSRSVCSLSSSHLNSESIRNLGDNVIIADLYKILSNDQWDILEKLNKLFRFVCAVRIST